MFLMYLELLIKRILCPQVIQMLQVTQQHQAHIYVVVLGLQRYLWYVVNNKTFFNEIKNLHLQKNAYDKLQN